MGTPLCVWLDNRSIDMYRSHSRILIKALGLRNSENTAELIAIDSCLLYHYNMSELWEGDVLNERN